MSQDHVLAAISTQDVDALNASLLAVDDSCDRTVGLNAAARIGWRDGVVIQHRAGARLDSTTLLLAAASGNVALIRYLHENGCGLTLESLAEAARHGRLETVRYLHQNGVDPRAAGALLDSARGGHLPVVQYLHQNGVPLDLDTDALFGLVHLEACDAVVKYFVSSGAAPAFTPALADLARAIHAGASASDIEGILRRLTFDACNAYLTWIERHAPGNPEAMRVRRILQQMSVHTRWLSTSILGGEAGVREWIQDSNAFDADACRKAFRLAAANGRTEIVRCLFGQSGVALDAFDAAHLAAANGRTDVVVYLHTMGVDLSSDRWLIGRAAAAYGHLETLTYLHRQGFPLTIAYDAAQRLATDLGAEECLRFIAESGGGTGLLEANEIARAIATGNDDRIDGILRRRSPSAAPAALLEFAAARNGAHAIESLMRAGVDVRAHGGRALVAAAARGHLDVVTTLHTHGADLSHDRPAALRVAAEAGHLAIVEYLHRAGLPMSSLPAETLDLVILNRHTDVLLYLTRNGCSAIGRHLATLHAMTSELSAAAPVYQPSKVWEYFNTVNLEQLRSTGIENFKRTLSQNYFTFIPANRRDPQLVQLRAARRRGGSRRRQPVRFFDPDRQQGNGRPWVPEEFQVFEAPTKGSISGLFRRWQRFHRLALYRRLMEVLWEEAECRDALGLASRLTEPRLGNPLLAWAGDRLVSQDLAHSILEANSILGEQAGGGAVSLRILEIGAGYGRLGHVLLEVTRCTYVVVDIPPALLISQWYLSGLFPQKRVFHFRPFADFETVREEFESCEIAFLLTSQLAVIPDGYFDIAVNISSLHELKPDQIDQALAQMYRVSRKDVYLKQYYEYPNPWDGLTIRKEAYSIVPGWSVVFDRGDGCDSRFFERLVRRDTPPPAAVAVAKPPKAPRVSLLIANFNHGRYLQTSLEAALAQTRPFDEIIVVDDGSSDGSDAVVATYQPRHASLRFVPLGQNFGQHHAIQRALVESTGDYIVWAASDDLLLPHFLERSLSALAQHPGSGLVFSRLATWIDGTDSWQEYSELNHGAAFDLGKEPLGLTPAELKALLARHYLWISGNTVLARRSAVMEMGGFARSLRWHADWFGFYAIALRYGVVGIPETLALMRERPGTYSSTGMNNPEEQRVVLRAIFDTLLLPENRDLRRIFEERPSLVSLFGPAVRDAIAWQPRYLSFFRRLVMTGAGRWPSRLAGLAGRVTRRLRKHLPRYS